MLSEALPAGPAWDAVAPNAPSEGLTARCVSCPPTLPYPHPRPGPGGREPEGVGLLLPVAGQGSALRAALRRAAFPPPGLVAP